MGFDMATEWAIEWVIELAIARGGTPDGLGQTADFPRRR